ncbi:cytochrome P450 [Nocardia colli]|uniref:Cytochrome P450 n=1 Tax=Nocardia colli TaxID=2545717 RepID=A0A5N0E2S0_9NOCA|nr:cytochrome P450 [Nocardia colli]
MRSRAVTSPIAPFDADYLVDPYVVHRKLRESAPVHRVVLPDGSEAWLVTREADVRRGLADPRLSIDKRSSSTGYTGFALPPVFEANLLNIDAPDHTRLRRLVSHAFTRRRVDSLQGKIQAETDLLLDRLAEREQSELIADFAAPLPLTVIGDLLGIPGEDRERFRGWTNALLAPDPNQPGQAKEAVVQMAQFMVDLVAAKRATPADDFLSDLIAVRDAGDVLTENELVSLAFLIFWAGYENAVKLIGKGVLALLDHPEQLAALRVTAPSISDSAVEELLRYAHPSQFAIRRFPTEDITIGDVRIPAGETVLLGTASANRDPLFVPDPETLDLSRPDNAHLALGHGIHYCLGAPLARLETRIALGSLLHRFPRIELAIPRDQIRWRSSFREHGLHALPLFLGG